MLAERRHRKLPAVWQSGEEVLHWWLQDGVLPGQLSISDYLTEME
jgi:phosphoadenosine phosphosulfate reductase